MYIVKDNCILINQVKRANKPIDSFPKIFQYELIDKINQEIIELNSTEFLLLSNCLKSINEEDLYNKVIQDIDIGKLEFQQIIRDLLNKAYLHTMEEEKCKVNSCVKTLENSGNSMNNIRFGPKKVICEVTHICNLKCLHCINNSLETMNKNNKVSIENYKRLFYEMDQVGSELLLISGGEPLTRPDIKEILAETLKYKFTVVLFTNATLINESILDFFEYMVIKKSNAIYFRISIDGLENSHDYIRGAGNFKRTINNIKLLRERNLKIQAIETMAMNRNINDIEDLALICINHGIDKLYVHPIQVFSSDVPEELKLSFEGRVKYYNKMNEIAKKYKEKISIVYKDHYFPVELTNKNLVNAKKVISMVGNEKKLNFQNCLAGIENIFVTASGDVYPCLLYKGNNKDCGGNIQKDTLLDIWESNAMNRCRTPIDEKKLTHCNKCKKFDICSADYIKKCRIGCEILTGDFWGTSDLCHSFSKELDLGL